MNNETQISKSAEGLTLVLGGTGKTGRRIAERLEERGVNIRIASRSAELRFDWNDRSNVSASQRAFF
ncbi:MAG: hypothetical protein AB8G16_11420 [Gammaproteobacteria bacterium]